MSKRSKLVCKTKQLYPRNRSSGQALVEGVCSLVLVTMVFVMLVCFMVNLHLMLLLRQQLNYVAEQAATYAANRPIATASDDTRAFVTSLESAMKLAGGEPEVTTEAIKINGVPGSKVTIKNKFGIFGVGQKNQVQLNIASVAVSANLGYLPLPDLWVGSGAGRGFIPAYNPNTNVAPEFGAAQATCLSNW